MSHSIKLLREQKEEYMDHLFDIMYESIYKVFKHVYQSIQSKKEILKEFQKELAQLPQWNQLKVDGLYVNLLDQSKCQYFPDLIKTIYVLSVKMVLLGVPQEHRQKIKIKVPDASAFYHRLLIHIARDVWKRPYLFYHQVKSIEQQNHLYQFETIIRRKIRTVIRDTLPMDLMVQQLSTTDVFNEDHSEEDSETETEHSEAEGEEETETEHSEDDKEEETETEHSEDDKEEETESEPSEAEEDKEEETESEPSEAEEDKEEETETEEQKIGNPLEFVIKENSEAEKEHESEFMITDESRIEIKEEDRFRENKTDVETVLEEKEDKDEVDAENTANNLESPVEVVEPVITQSEPEMTLYEETPKKKLIEIQEPIRKHKQKHRFF